MSTKLEKADFAAGCFWGIQSAYDNLPGVAKTIVGYEGGHTQHPSYEDVLTHTTNHAETVQVIYDPTKVAFEELLRHFFMLHDPTYDMGEHSNYRSAIFYHSQAQKTASTAYIKKLLPKYASPIVTEVTAATTFWPAEDYHQHYYAKMGIAPHC